MKSYIYWTLLFFGSLVLLTMSITGRLAIATAIAILPDDVAVVGGTK